MRKTFSITVRMEPDFAERLLSTVGQYHKPRSLAHAVRLALQDWLARHAQTRPRMNSDELQEEFLKNRQDQKMVTNTKFETLEDWLAEDKKFR